MIWHRKRPPLPRSHMPRTSQRVYARRERAGLDRQRPSGANRRSARGCTLRLTPRPCFNARPQGLIAVAIEAQRDEPSVLHAPDDCGFALDLDAALAAPAGGAQQGNDLRSHVDELLGLPDVGLPHVSNLGVEPPDSFVPVVHSWVEDAIRHIEPESVDA